MSDLHHPFHAFVIDKILVTELPRHVAADKSVVHIQIRDEVTLFHFEQSLLESSPDRGIAGRRFREDRFHLEHRDDGQNLFGTPKLT